MLCRVETLASTGDPEFVHLSRRRVCRAESIFCWYAEPDRLVHGLMPVVDDENPFGFEVYGCLQPVESQAAESVNYDRVLRPNGSSVLHSMVRREYHICRYSRELVAECGWYMECCSLVNDRILSSQSFTANAIMSTLTFAELLLDAIAWEAIGLLTACIRVDTKSVADSKSRLDLCA